MKSPLKEIIVALLIGIVVGWFAADKFDVGRPNWKKGQMLEHFSQELKLDAEQKQKITKIMESKKTQLDSLKKDMQPRFDEIRNAARVEIRNLLAPEQQIKFDRLEEKRKLLREKRHLKHDR